MPTEEDKKRAQLKAASADPLVWAMKSVDDKFPDEREKNAETIKAEAEVEMTMGPTEDEDILDDIDEEPAIEEVKEIKAEGKTAMPTDGGVITVDVAPMRQNMDKVTSKEVNRIEGKKTEIENKKKIEKVERAEKTERAKKADAEFKEAKKVQKFKKFQQPKKTDPQMKKMMFAIGALAIIALAGVGFGVVAMINQKEATSELANQIVVSSSHDNLVDDEFIYLKDWNMKIKIISGLDHVTFDYDETSDGYGKVLIWGARKENGANYTPDFAKQSKNGNALGIVTRIPRYERAAAGRLIWYDDYYNYYYQGPSSEPEASESEMSWWVESYLLIKEMLTNADNYIKFDETTISQQ
jgi:hypothetical protein